MYVNLIKEDPEPVLTAEDLDQLFATDPSTPTNDGPATTATPATAASAGTTNATTTTAAAAAEGDAGATAESFDGRDLTLHGVTRSVTFDVTAQADASRIGVLGSIPIVFADYEIENPSISGITTEDHGLLEFILVLERPERRPGRTDCLTGQTA